MKFTMTAKVNATFFLLLLSFQVFTFISYLNFFIRAAKVLKKVVKFRFFTVYQLIISRDHIQKIRPIREDLDAAVSPQKINQISGQSRITLLNK
jgi:hypothetical protein